MEREPRDAKEKVRPRPSLGVNLLRDADRAEVYDVVPDSAAHKASIKAGDVVLELDGVKISGGAEMAAKIGSRKAGDDISMRLLRGEQELELKVTLGAAE